MELKERYKKRKVEVSLARGREKEKGREKGERALYILSSGKNFALQRKFIQRQLV